MSTLRERIEALAKEYEAHAARIPWGDKCDALMSHAQDLRSALESETRATEGIERCLRAIANDGCGCHDGVMGCRDWRPGQPDTWCWSCVASAEIEEFDRSLSTPPPANTENDR